MYICIYIYYKLIIIYSFYFKNFKKFFVALDLVKENKKNGKNLKIKQVTKNIYFQKKTKYDTDHKKMKQKTGKK